jgi:hypothetical protein
LPRTWLWDLDIRLVQNIGSAELVKLDSFHDLFSLSVLNTWLATYCTGEYVASQVSATASDVASVSLVSAAVITVVLSGQFVAARLP